MAMNIFGMKNRLVFIFTMSIIFIMLIVIIIKVNSNHNIKLTFNKGNIGNAKINITYTNKQDPFNDVFSYTISNLGINVSTEDNIRCTSGFANVEPLMKFLKQNNYNENDFTKKVGSLYMYRNYEGKNYYLLLNINTLPYCWNLIVENSGEYKLIKVIEVNKNTDNDYRFAVNIENINDRIYLYLDSGLYAINSDYSVECVKEWNLNRIFLEICNDGIRTHNTQIKYLDNNLYLLASAEGYKEYYLVKYNISENSFEKFKTKHSAQGIITLNDNISIISVDENRVFIETYSSKLKCKEINDISDLNLNHFTKNTILNKISIIDGKLYILLSSIKEIEPRTYIFCLDSINFNLLGIKEITLKNIDYIIYGISIN